MINWDVLASYTAGGALMAMMAISMCAIPATPGLTRTITLSDGTTMTARLVGDEHGQDIPSGCG